jgi:hypothetical protein
MRSRHRLPPLLAALALAAVLLPIGIGTATAQDMRHDGSFSLRVDGNVTVAAGEHVDTLVVIGGDATVAGEVNTLVVIDGRAILDGATLETVFVARGAVEVGAGTRVTDLVRYVDATYSAAPDAQVASARSIDPTLIIAALAPLGIALWFGSMVATLLAGLVLAGIGGAQLRRAGAAMTETPGATAVAALGVLLGLPFLAIVLFATVVGIPAGVAVLLVVLPLLWFLGAVVVAVRIGDWLVARLRGHAEPGHPYLATILGLVIVGVLGLVPLLGFLVALAGAGAVALLAWRAAFGGATLPATTRTPGAIGV